jgi:hypothetical protein
MGLLTDDEALIDAALSEIIGLPVEDQLRRDPGRDVESLLTNHYLAEVCHHGAFLELASQNQFCRATSTKRNPYSFTRSTLSHHL